jgi:hypothetical protein
LTALIFAGALVGTSSPAQAAATGADTNPTPAGGSTAISVRSATTEQIRAMAAHGNGKLITFGAPAAKGQNSRDAVVAAATTVTCYLYIGIPYGGGASNAHIFVDGAVYCDDYVHLGVLTVELFRGVDRVAYRTAAGAYVSALYSTPEYSTCNEGVYFGIVGATLTRYDLTPQTITANYVGYPIYIGCGPPPPPPSTPLAVANPGNRQSLEDSAASVQMTATGGTPPYTWSATGLPTGLSISPSTGLISGSTIRAGGFAITVTATDAAGGSASTQFTWAVKRDGCARC